jgi:ankyrin repeat protein
MRTVRLFTLGLLLMAAFAPSARAQADAYGNTPLHKAVEANDLAAVERLIAARADVNAANRFRTTPLAIAATRGHAPIVAALLRGGADANATRGEGEPVLLSAARSGSVETVRALIEAGADITARDRFYGQTAVMWAAIENHPAVIAELVERGADVNARAHILEGEPSWRYGKDSRNGINGEALQNFNTNFSKGGLTPLMYAARQGATDAVRMLVDKGALTETTDPEGYAALHIAIMNAQFDAAAALVEKGADVNQGDRNGQTPLFALVDIRSLLWTYNRPTPRSQTEIGTMELAALLLDKGAIVDPKLTGPARRPLGGGGHALTGRGATPFLRAAVTSDLPMMRLLLEQGADPKITTPNGHNALHAAAGLRWNETTMSTAISEGFATEEDSIAAITLLLEQGLDINAADTNGFTAMHGAAERGANQIVKFLFERGGKLDVSSKPSVRRPTVDNEPPLDIPGQTPLDAALDADPPKPETAALIRELMGLPPDTGDRDFRRIR